ncbi:hypothetical protein NBRC116594_04080 [Shimia sp. NS0008-38b]|uniref:MliC family protein n=1 Tax=Shimia sp. NS0008-38b TaxID=3127653 RepID=UPI00310B216B
MIRRWVFGAAGLVVASLAVSQARADAVQTAGYRCDRDAWVDATYINAADVAYAVLVVEGRQVALVAERSGSGARYGPADGGSSGYVWHTKGAEAVLFWRDAAQAEEMLMRCAEDLQ